LFFGECFALNSMPAREYHITRPSAVALTGTLLEAARSCAESERPCIVLTHGLLSHRDHNFAPALAEALHKATGHAVYRFDFRFHADEREPEFRYRFSGFADDCDDLLVVLRALKADGLRPWCLVGHSRGANGVLLAAASPAILAEFSSSDAELGRPVLAVAALAARYIMPHMFARIFSAAQQAAVDDPAQGHAFTWHSKRGDLPVSREDADVVRRHMSMPAIVRAIPPSVPVFHAHGAEDEVIPVSDAVQMAAARRKRCAACGCSIAGGAAGGGDAADGAEAAAAQPLVCVLPSDPPTGTDRLVASFCGDILDLGVAPRAEARPHPLFPLAPSLPPLSDCTCAVPTQPSSTLVVVEGARHAFAGKVPQRTLLRAVTEWLLEQAKVLKVPVVPLLPSVAEAGSAAVAAAKAARGAALAGKGKTRGAPRAGAGSGSTGDALGDGATAHAAVDLAAQGEHEGAEAPKRAAAGSPDATSVTATVGLSTASEAPIVC
jgi:pimeloyl-ACP methyl ester carboxylesterase